MHPEGRAHELHMHAPAGRLILGMVEGGRRGGWRQLPQTPKGQGTPHHNTDPWRETREMEEVEFNSRSDSDFVQLFLEGQKMRILL